ncbi:MAG: hypothetical protein R6U11_03800 [Bacteroidales bacterium]
MTLKIRSSNKQIGKLTSYLPIADRINVDSINIIKDSINNEICIEIDNCAPSCYVGDPVIAQLGLNPEQAILLGNMLVSMAKNLNNSNEHCECI